MKGFMDNQQIYIRTPRTASDPVRYGAPIEGFRRPSTPLRWRIAAWVCWVGFLAMLAYHYFGRPGGVN